jgi:hypothetical protein
MQQLEQQQARLQAQQAQAEAAEAPGQQGAAAADAVGAAGAAGSSRGGKPVCGPLAELYHFPDKGLWTKLRPGVSRGMRADSAAASTAHVCMCLRA